MTAADHGPLDPAIVAALYGEYGEELLRFVTGVLRDGTSARDVVQAAFEKLAQQGSGTREESRKAWLFRTAFHEALDWRRRSARRDSALRQLAARPLESPTTPEANSLRLEKIERVRAALRRLPAEQQEVVRLRIYEERSFAEIAAQLSIPLGTALGRMHLAVRKLRDALEADSHDD